MVQLLRPASNVTQTGVTGGFAAIDEVTASDADFVSGTNGGGNVLEVGISAPSSTPQSGTCTLRFRAARLSNGTPTTGGTQIDIVPQLFVGAGEIATLATASPAGAWTTYSRTFAASLVTNWSDLRLRFSDNSHGGNPGNRRAMGISWAEIETPDGVVVVALTPTNLSTSAPSLAAAGGFGQVHAVTGQAMSTSAVAIAAATMAQAHSLDADQLVTASPSLASIAMSVLVSLSAAGLATGRPELGTPEAGEIALAIARLDTAFRTDFTYSNGDTTATAPADTSFRGTRSLNAKGSGKRYFEIDYQSAVGSMVGVGFITAAAGNNGTGGFGTSRVGWEYNSIRDSGDSFTSMGATIGSGTRVGVAIDLDAGLFWMRTGTIDWNNDAGADPATGTGGLPADLGGPLFIALNTQREGTATLVSVPAQYDQPAPDGFGQWEPAAGLVELVPVTLATAAPVLAGSAMAQAHALTGAALVTAAAELDVVQLVQAHGLLADPLATAAPALGLVTVSQLAALSPAGLTTGTPQLAAVSIGEANALQPHQVDAGTPQLAAPAMAQTHGMTGQALTTGIPALASSALFQLSALTALDLTGSVPGLGTSTLAQLHALAADGVATAAPVVAAVALAQLSAIYADSLATASPVLGVTALAVVVIPEMNTTSARRQKAPAWGKGGRVASVGGAGDIGGRTAAASGTGSRTAQAKRIL